MRPTVIVFSLLPLALASGPSSAQPNGGTSTCISQTYPTAASTSSTFLYTNSPSPTPRVQQCGHMAPPCKSGYQCKPVKPGASYGVCVKNSVPQPQVCGPMSPRCPYGLVCVGPVENFHWGLCVDAQAAPKCGGFAGFKCPGQNMKCWDVPDDGCSPEHGADCMGVCVKCDNLDWPCDGKQVRM